jgi:hypothetical protein
MEIAGEGCLGQIWWHWVIRLLVCNFGGKLPLMPEKTILKACDQLYNELQAARSPLVSFFQPGIAKQAVDAALKKGGVGIKLPDEVYSLYEWRNGIGEEKLNSMALGEVALFTLAVFNSLNLAIETYHSPDLRSYAWCIGLFPLFESFAGDFYFIDTNEESDTYKMIMFYSFSNPYISKATSVFDSLYSCLTTVAECYKKGAYFYIPGLSYLETNRKQEISIWENNNPKSEYFKILRNS